MNKKKDVNSLVCGAVIAALYAALTYAASAVNLAYKYGITNINFDLIYRTTHR